MEQWKTYVAAVGDDVRGRLGDLAATGTFVAVLTPMDFTVWDTGSAAGWVGLYGAGAVAEAERRRGTPFGLRSQLSVRRVSRKSRTAVVKWSFWSPATMWPASATSR